MKKEFLKNGIIMPVVLGILLCIVFFLFISNTDVFSPFAPDTVFAYHDEIITSSDVEKGNEASDGLADNEKIGELYFKDTKLDIRYNADYSNLAGSSSLMPQSDTIGQTGCCYIHIYPTNMGDLENVKMGDSIKISGINGDFEYKFISSYIAKNEYSILTENPNQSKALIIYCEKSDGAGLTSEYEAYVFGR